MSCLLLEDEQAATLAEALAFLDEFSHFEADSSTANGYDLDEGVASDDTTDSDQSLRVYFRLPPSSSSSASLPPRLEARNRDRRNAVIGQTPQLSNQRSTLPKRKASTTLADIKKQQPQKRQRDASRVRELREQVLHLTAQLVRLQELADKQPSNENPPSLRCLENAVDSLGDRGVAMLELERLQRSETLNRKLKEALAKQRKQSTTVAKILHKQLTQHDKELLVPPKQEHTSSAWHDTPILSELFDYTDRLYDRVSEVTATISMRNTSRVFNNSHVYDDPVHGQVQEFTTNTPLPYSVRQLEAYLWRHVVRSDPAHTEKHRWKKRDEHDENSYETQFKWKVLGCKEREGDASANSCEAQYSVNVPNAFEDVLLDGVIAIRRFRECEPNRSVILFTSLSTSERTGLVIRENAWMILTATKDEKAESSRTLFQTCFEIYAENSAKKGSSRHLDSRLCDLVLHAKSESMRAKQLHMQRTLVDCLASFGSVEGTKRLPNVILQCEGEAVDAFAVQWNEKLMHTNIDSHGLDESQSILFKSMHSLLLFCSAETLLGCQNGGHYSVNSMMMMMMGHPVQNFRPGRGAHFATHTQKVARVGNMATFLLEDEQVATLEEVLGFIDTHEPLSFALDGDASWEEDTSSSKGTTSDHSSDSEHLDVLPLPVLLAEPPAKRGSHRKQHSKACAEQPQGKSTYTEATKKAITKYRKRNKTEIIELREQVLQLTSRLANLRERNENAQKTASARRMAAATMSRFSNGPVTREQAMTEFQLLQQSESLNRKLKEAVKRHAKVNKSIDDVFRRQTIQQNMAILRELETPKARQLYIPMEPVVQSTARIFQHLYRDLHACYLDTPSVSGTINVRTSSTTFSNSSVYEDPRHGRVYEFTTNTPCACSLQYLNKYFWGRIGGSDFKEKMGYTYKYSKTDPNGYNSEKHSTTTIDCEDGEILVDTVMVMRKFEEPNRTVFVGNAIAIPLETGLLFRERIWIIVSEVPTAPGAAPRSVIQTCFRNHETKSFAGASSISPQSAYIREFVQQAQIEKMRSAMLFMQTVLLQQQTDLHNGAFDDVSPYTLPSQLPRLLGEEEQAEDEQGSSIFISVSAMSTRFFLEEEHVATLEEALAFIDECAQDDGDGDGNGAISGSEESSGATSDASFFSSSRASTTTIISTNDTKAAADYSTDENAADRDAPSVKPSYHAGQSKRVTNTKAVGRYRRRNKDEILELRGKVTAMEARIEYLRRRKDAWSVARKLQYTREPDLTLLASDPVLLEMFATLIGIDKFGLERRRLEQALLVNQRLRTVLMGLLSMGTTLDSIFSKHISKEDLYFLFGIEPQFNMPPAAPLPASDSLVFASLHHSLETQYLTSMTMPDVLTAACAQMDQVFTISRVLEHPLVGQIREVNSSTPLVLSLQKLVEMREGFIHGSGGERKKRSKPFTQTRTGPYEDSIEKQYTMAFRTSQCGDVHVNAVSVGRKYVQEDRVLYTYTSRLAVVGTGLVFREFGCMILVDASSTNSSAANNTSKKSSSNHSLTASSVYQVSYQIFTETRDPHMPPGISAYLEDFITSSQSNQMRAHRLEVQNMLMHEFGCRPPPMADMRGCGTKLLIECPAR